MSGVTKTGKNYDVASEEFGEDTIKQAAIALEQAVLEYNKRIQQTEGNDFKLEVFNIADFTRTSNSQEITQTVGKLCGDLVSHIPKRTVDYNNPEVLETAGVIPCNEETNQLVLNATRITANSISETNNNSRINEQTKNDAPYSVEHLRTNSVIEGNSVKAHLPIQGSEDSNALEDLIFEEILLRESTNITQIEQQNNNNNNTNNSNNTESKAPLLTNIRITLNTNKDNENVREINIQLSNTSQQSDSDKTEIKDSHIPNERNRENISKPTTDASKEPFQFHDKSQTNYASSDNVRDHSKSLLSNAIEPREAVHGEGDCSLTAENKVILPFSQEMQEGLAPSLQLTAPLFEQIQERRGKSL